ncbi:alpha/beta hydrolase family protein [Colwellia sp. Bg11-28]|uniref:alpha/beta hydrolase family protein n=1 Tax=Colwellia sp. Bg11-28 TaxID=2058305 RepID=UPI000C34B298|nr:alpha/beta fold hydrolase [Colwellia sp. Bg11-28]PKH86282.1 peptidase S9 [Colwellia sp. Bg11-28]
MYKFLIKAILLGLIFISAMGYAKNWDGIFERAQYQNAKISPDGKHLAVSVFNKGEATLVFVDSKTLKPLSGSKLPGRLEINQYYWVNNERVVISLAKRDPWLEEPVSYGELFAINMDGSRGKMIYGYRAGETQTGSFIKKKESTFGWGKIIDILPEDKKHILISSTPMSATEERNATVLKLNVYTGVIKRKVVKSPVPFARFLTDGQGKVKFVVGRDGNNDTKLYFREDGKWKHIPQDIVGSRVQPLFIDASGKSLYTFDDYQQDIKGIFKLNLENFQYKSVYTDKKVDITDVEMTTDKRSAYAVRVDDGYPAYLILNKKHEEAKVFKELLKLFPYSSVKVTSKTEDGQIYVVFVSSDIDPGSLYLLDRESNKLKRLFQFKPEFQSADFAQVEPIKFEASDGSMLNGFFTQAKAKQKNELAPTVVLVHGGPHGVRDYWEFSSQVQYLVAHGYSVLQVNFRGSGGYGVNYQRSGYKAWGGLVQQDILDGYQWLVKNKKAADNKVCIMGGSFGAYSAIQSAALYPDVYKCAIANAGIYDLELMFEEGDVQQKRSGMSYLKHVLGTDEQLLKSMSPVNYVEKIQVPILLAHGEKDERAPFEHAERLRAALDKENKSYEWFVIGDESHGFFNPKNQRAYMKQVVGFLDKHLL